MNGLFVLGRDQQNAVRMAVDWLRYGNFDQKPVFVIAGLAGSGKSSCASHIILESGIPNYKIAYVCYTGKAASVLRQKGLNAVTVHRLIYNTSISRSGNPVFRRKKNLPGNIELICVDELGMLPPGIMNDLISYNVPILGLGDPGQLPPIYGENQYIQNPDCFLNEVFRQKGGSPILDLAMDIRNGINIWGRKYGKGVDIVTVNQMDTKMVRRHDIMTCSTNENRVMLNVEYRKMMGYKSPMPQENEKVICCVNNFKDVYNYQGLEVCMVNGILGTLISPSYEIDIGTIFFAFTPEGMEGLRIPVYSERDQFMSNYEDFGQKADSEIPRKFVRFISSGSGEKVVHRMDYAYACTVHRLQGSQARRVLVYDDCFYRGENEYRRWLYTAVTRAEEHVTIVRL